ncbi:SDR family NAD(P)-dependent oxidoreductase [Bradyrhizobium sp. LHD-71]|uniref:SDR family NAD(P)-dependent oxidoreductase n=1 Tax=Bradyrhizobium sp. LHD-71 TaxID=3072141 RepID=UPI00280D94FA|nr:SDR family NAD(P)-dependent oxidoreductase [Bradyrhizobium sp. LHD-71]MDQ8728518.1 SDR family NAD(P)-dependent oxidoreductase [Bradyrhizobium sp. LHD-71]
MLIRFDGRTAIVAGAARGIGRAIARSLASDGASVVACDLLIEELEAIAGPVEGGGKIAAAKVDVSDETAIAEIVRAAGTPDILVYVAGGVRGQKPRPLEEISAEDFDAIVEANLKGAFLFAKAVAPAMKAKGSGRIITISSRAGLATSLTGIQSYAASKHGQIGLVKQLAQELGPFGITVNSVAPGFMATSPDYERQWQSWTPEFRETFVRNIAMRRMGEPKDIADAVTFLASDRASWITGQTLAVTGSPLV